MSNDLNNRVIECPWHRKRIPNFWCIHTGHWVTRGRKLPQSTPCDTSLNVPTLPVGLPSMVLYGVEEIARVRGSDSNPVRALPSGPDGW
jgi:hypothetical protein